MYVFDGTTYTGFNETTDENGQSSITLPAGNYRFRADFNATQFWSGETDHCAIPGCLQALAGIPGRRTENHQATSRKHVIESELRR